MRGREGGRERDSARERERARARERERACEREMPTCENVCLVNLASWRVAEKKN